MIAASGTAYVLASAVTGIDPEIGVGMAILGAVLAGLGWLVSAPKRFTRKLPKPAKDVGRAERAIRKNKPAAIFANILMAVILLAMTFLLPRGLAPDVLPITAALSVWGPLYGALLLRVSKLLAERSTIYERWLQSRGPGKG
jgi:cytochrome b